MCPSCFGCYLTETERKILLELQGNYNDISLLQCAKEKDPIISDQGFG
ncbi:MAG: hypothetical protein ACI93R_002793 [Flavobacteriales bacterium]|jgi:hypothetical protein